MTGKQDRVDVAIVGAGVVGASVAYWLTRLDPSVSVALIERDPGFVQASSQRSASSIRQQFSSPVNIRLSQFGLGFLQEAATLLEVDGDAPAIGLTTPGYLYLAEAAQAAGLRAQNVVQCAEGALIDLLDPQALAARFPWLAVDDLALGSHGPGIEGWFDGPALHAALLRRARAQGAWWLPGTVTGFTLGEAQPGHAPRIESLTLADGQRLACGQVVLAAGAWSRPVAAWAGLEVPVHARRRTVFVLSCPTALSGCPLVIDPSGFWFRPEGRHDPARTFLAGTTPEQDLDDLPLDPDLFSFESSLWPGLARRVPAFEALRVERAWAGYYEMNLWDHNALLGPHPDRPNLLLATGFSGHGMQQAPGAGRGLAEWILYGQWRTLDLSDLAASRLAEGRRIREANVIG